MAILSIQSHVAHGYVGNRAATFPLQRIGHEVITINTVQFSNHTGYGKWKGDIFSSHHIKDVIQGLDDLGVLGSVDAVLSGYLGDASIGDEILKAVSQIREINPEVIYCCDTVMGDVGRGFYARPGIFEFFKSKAISEADIITPNQFEAENLSGIKIKSLKDAKGALKKLASENDIKIAAITSLDIPQNSKGFISVLLYKDGDFHFVETPRLAFEVEPNGTGDMFAALLLGHYMSQKDPVTAVEKTVTTLYGVLTQTKNRKRRELDIIAAQDIFSSKDPIFYSVKL